MKIIKKALFTLLFLTTVLFGALILPQTAHAVVCSESADGNQAWYSWALEDWEFYEYRNTDSPLSCAPFEKIVWEGPTEDSYFFQYYTGSCQVSTTCQALTIDNPDSITKGGSLEYSFTGFQPGRTLEMWVNRRGESGSGNKTGGFVYPDVNEKGEGGGIITGLTESAGEYTLRARVKETDDIPAQADFTIAAIYSGTVYEDTNRTEAIDEGDKVKRGVTVKLIGYICDSYGCITETTDTTTDENGGYSFSVPQGNYDLELDIPSGYRTTTTKRIGASLSGTNNFLLDPPPTISGTVYYDANRNGRLEEGETKGVSGTIVKLSKDGGNLVGEITPSADGKYKFVAAPGSYRVSLQRIPEKYENTAGEITPITITSWNTGEEDTVINLGIAPFHKVSGIIYSDNDRDDIKDEGETGLGGVTVKLGDNSLTTSGNGAYEFRVPSNTYTLHAVQVPEEYIDRYPLGNKVDNISAPLSRTADIIVAALGIRPKYTISGTVYYDNDRNRILNAEEGVNGVTVNLLNENGTETISTTTTASDGANSGRYKFTSLNPGNHKIKLDVPAGFEETTANPTESFNLHNISSPGRTFNFGIVSLPKVSGIIYNDINGNGQKVDGENGVRGITVKLQGCYYPQSVSSETISNCIWADYPTLGTITTGNDGKYEFKVGPSTSDYNIEYRIKVGLQEEYRLMSSNPSNPTEPFTLNNDHRNEEFNFGIARPFVISGTLYYDKDGDGKQDGIVDTGPAEEGGVNGVTVKLTSSSGSPTTTTTNSFGVYEFAGIYPGEYRLEIPDISTSTYRITENSNLIDFRPFQEDAVYNFGFHLIPCQVTTSPPSNISSMDAKVEISASVTSGSGTAEEPTVSVESIKVFSMNYGAYEDSGKTVVTLNHSSQGANQARYDVEATAIRSGGETAVWATAHLTDGRTCETTGNTDTNITVRTCGIDMSSSSQAITIDRTNPIKIGITADNITRMGTAEIDRVDFFTANNSTDIISFFPLDDRSSPYETTIDTHNRGEETVFAEAVLKNGRGVCETPADNAAHINVLDPTPCTVTVQPDDYTSEIGRRFSVGASITEGLGEGAVTDMSFGSRTEIITVGPQSRKGINNWATIATTVKSGNTSIYASANVDDDGDGETDRVCETKTDGSTDADIIVPACEVIVPAALDVNRGEEVKIKTGIENVPQEVVAAIRLESTNGNIATARRYKLPSSDGAVTGVTEGNTEIRTTAELKNGESCSGITKIHVSPPRPGYVLCGSGLTCENNITVDSNCSAGYNKCLSSSEGFDGSDRIDGKSLTCCNSPQNYRLVNNECTLVLEGSYSENPSCEPPPPVTKDDYVPCGQDRVGSSDPATISSPCGNGNSKCLYGGPLVSTYNQDTINLVGLRCAEAHEYALINNICTLVQEVSPTEETACISGDLPSLDSTPSVYCDNWFANVDISSCGTPHIFSIKDYPYTLTSSQYCEAAQLVPFDEMINWTPSCQMIFRGITGTKVRCCYTQPNPIAALTVSPNTITEGGSLSYNFTGFGSGETVNVWVVGSPAGDTLPKIADGSGNGAGTISESELSKPAGSWVLKAEGSWSGRSAEANFNITGSSACPTLTGPTGLNCNIVNNTVSWDPVDGATGYNIRINNLNNPWMGDCTTTVTQYDGDVCDDNVSGTSGEYTFETGKISRRYTFVPETNYTFAVHTVNTCGGGRAAEIRCSGPTSPAATSYSLGVQIFTDNDNNQRWDAGEIIPAGLVATIDGKELMQTTADNEPISFSRPAGSYSLTVCAPGGYVFRESSNGTKYNADTAEAAPQQYTFNGANRTCINFTDPNFQANMVYTFPVLSSSSPFISPTPTLIPPAPGYTLPYINELDQSPCIERGNDGFSCITADGQTGICSYDYGACIMPVTIQGRNVDDDGNTLSSNLGQQISLTGPIGNTLLTSKTFTKSGPDNIGSWDFSRIPAGTYEITASPIANYDLSYSSYLCTEIDCSASSPSHLSYTPYASAVSVNLPLGGNYADIFFKYVSTPPDGDGDDITSPPSSSVGWIQSVGTDLRWDKIGGFNNPIPQGKYASLKRSNDEMPGIIFSGKLSPNFDSGQASEKNWKVGNPIYFDIFTTNHSIIPTSYRFLLETAEGSGIAKKGVADLCSGGSDPTNCALTPALANGVYKIDGNLNLNGAGYTFPANKDFVILIYGNLNINEKIFVPVGSTAIFSASGDITVGQNVGEIEGLYSADKNFNTTDKNPPNDCTAPAIGDLRLNISGSVIANAARQEMSFVNNRTLCRGNSANPSVTFIERPDFMLNYPSFVTQTPKIWQEVTP